MRKSETGSGKLELGSGTRRRPIGRDYAAAKDAEVGRDRAKRREHSVWDVTRGSRALRKWQ
jgi:hypothetical protein